jgi:hypothetical protein
MKVNVGTADRVIRIGAGAVLVALAAFGQLGAWAWIGILPLATGLLGNCPAYSMLGISTCPMKGAAR